MSVRDLEIKVQDSELGHFAMACQPVFEKTCEATQKKRKKSCFLDFEKKTLKNVPVGLLNL